MVNWQSKTIWTGDCLEIMRGMNSESVDVMYLDPPFNSNADYAAPIGSAAAGAAFKDTWTLTDIDVEWINLIEGKYPALYRVLLATMTNTDKAYLVYMAARMLEMRRILKCTGSIYLHCDPTMSHYLKLVMDAIFGRKNFRNEIIWSYKRWATKSKHKLNSTHDILLWYSKSDAIIFTYPMLENTTPNPSQYVSAKDVGGKTVVKRDADGRPVKRKVAAEIPASDVWNLPIISPVSRERTGYPTQKPLALLRRIIAASSNAGDVILDPFCGCATTCVAAEGLGRQWAGIDISPKAAELVVRRIEDHQGLWREIIPRIDIPHRTDLGDIPPYNALSNKKYLYGEQGGKCAGCSTLFEIRHFEVDHIIARRKGGTDHLDNLQLLCGNCNRVKGDRGMDYLRTKLQMT